MQGTGIFWEKDWGFINAESYYAHTVPIIHRYIELCRQDGIYLKLMQNGAPRHLQEIQKLSFTREVLLGIGERRSFSTYFCAPWGYPTFIL